jgi:hypothetical protein
MLSAFTDVIKALSWIIIFFVGILLLGSILGVAIVDTPGIDHVIALPQPAVVQQTSGNDHPAIITRIEIPRYGKDCPGYDPSLASGPEKCFPPEFSTWSLEDQNRWISDQKN